MTPKFALFDPLCMKIRGGVGEISLPVVEVLTMTELPKYS